MFKLQNALLCIYVITILIGCCCGLAEDDVLDVVGGTSFVVSSETPHKNDTKSTSSGRSPGGDVKIDGKIVGDENAVCKYQYQPSKHTNNQPEDELLLHEQEEAILEGNFTERCKNGNICYSFWQQLANDTRVFIKQGCWEHPGHKETCTKSECVATRSVRQLPDAYFCCCAGPFCNEEVSIGDLEPILPYKINTHDIPLTTDPNYKRRTIIVALSSVLSVAVVTIAVYLVYRLCIGGYKGSEDLECQRHSYSDSRYGTSGFPNYYTTSLDGNDPKGGGGHLGFGAALCDISTIKLKRLLGRGRYGNVWKATVQGKMPVAIKIFKPVQHSYYENECEIYRLAHMDHWALTKFYGCHKGNVPSIVSRDDLDNSESDIDNSDYSSTVDSLGDDSNLSSSSIRCYAIIMNYVPLGSLTKYLKENTIDWQTLCKMSHSVSAGLAHLHSDFTKNGEVKPAVVHRDLNSRNILVQSNLTCVICDFGLALRVTGNKSLQSTGDDSGNEHPSLRDVGTLRYMAPEVLEGAVNLRDCASSLKQIDVYALGLVLWEIASRCHDLYQGMPVPMYQLPFQPEIGSHPTFEDMQQVVVNRKERPPKPDVWKDSNLAIKAMKDTLDDCWDQDAEARLTAPCVKERVYDFSNLWIARNKGLSANINQTMSPLSDDEMDIRLQPDSDRMAVAHLLASTGADQDYDTRLIAQNQLNTLESALHGSSPPPYLSSTVPGGDSEVTSSANGGRYLRLSSASTSSTGPPSVGTNPNRFSTFSLSTATTDTILSPVTGENDAIIDQNGMPAAPTKANCNLFAYNRLSAPIRQGSNPTFERNTHKCSDEQLAILGNNLVDKRVGGDVEDHTVETYPAMPEPFETVAGRLETSLVQSETLSRQIEVAVAATGPSGPPVDGNEDETDGLSQSQVPPNRCQPIQEHGQQAPLMPPVRQPKRHNTDISASVSDNPSQPEMNRDIQNKRRRSNRWLSRLFSKIYKHDGNASSVNADDAYDEEAYPTENLCDPEPGVAAMTSARGITSVGVINLQQTMDFNQIPQKKSNLCPRSPATSHSYVAVIRPQQPARSSQRASMAGTGISTAQPDASVIGTEVRMVNGLPVVRPASLDLTTVHTSSQSSRAAGFTTTVQPQQQQRKATLKGFLGGRQDHSRTSLNSSASSSGSDFTISDNVIDDKHKEIVISNPVLKSRSDEINSNQDSSSQSTLDGGSIKNEPESDGRSEVRWNPIAPKSKAQLIINGGDKIWPENRQTIIHSNHQGLEQSDKQNIITESNVNLDLLPPAKNCSLLRNDGGISLTDYECVDRSDSIEDNCLPLNLNC